MKLRERFSAALKVFAAGATSMSASDLWQAILRGNGVTSSSGKAVTDTTAMQVSTLVACLQVISGSITQLPVDLYRKGKDGYDEKLPLNNLWWLLNESPYPGWTAASWRNGSSSASPFAATRTR